MKKLLIIGLLLIASSAWGQTEYIHLVNSGRGTILTYMMYKDLSVGRIDAFIQTILDRLELEGHKIDRSRYVEYYPNRGLNPRVIFLMYFHRYTLSWRLIPGVSLVFNYKDNGYWKTVAYRFK
jgi:hypothetical protein